eukprot:TRINITY_DN5999_c0_g1_i2.p1 TRINITY_DN5999_c0_g1~~TRINITY_DN5999_c0_g1_i2.p1  ORF type:complete len:259 (-),score=33.70 TRINITY_DN5999_c0_g1_i2:82-858(-)
MCIHSVAIITFVSAGFMFISTLLTCLGYFGAIKGKYPSFDLKVYPEGRLSADYLDLVWEWRNSMFPTQIAIDFFITTSLIMLTQGIHVLKKIHTEKYSMIHRVMYNLFLAGAILPSIEFLENLGTSASSAEIWNYKDLANPDKRHLEISYFINQSRSVWVFSIFYVCLGIAFVLYFVLNLKHLKINKGHGVIGLICAILCFIAFGLAIGSFFQSALLVAFGGVNLVLMGIAFPVWLIWLGVFIHKQFRTKIQDTPKTE